jgi:DNA-binding transcriptional ArsR family regulator
MKKEEIVKQLEATKALSSQVDIDKVIALIEQIESEAKIGITQALADEVANRIERALDHNCDDLVDLDSAEFELTYDNRIELSRVDINVRDIMEHITSIVDEYVNELEEEVDGFIEAQNEAEQAQNENPTEE